MKRLQQSGFLLSAMLAAHAATAAEGGIPQMDQTWYANQLFWLAIAFTLLYIIVSRVIAPSIHSVLDARETAIREAIAEAEKARSQADATRGDATNVSQSARAQAAEIMAAAQAENTRDAATEMAKLDHELVRKASHADAVLDAALAKANLTVEAAAQSLAEAMAAQLLAASGTIASDEPKLKLAKR